jgi:L-iditol 2-dehydrogenase
VDIVFDCCGKQEAIDQAIEILKPGGKILIVGIPEFDNWQIPADLTRRKEISLQNVRRQNNCLQKAIDLIADGSVDARPLITHEFPFHRTAEAFELVSAYRDGVMKAMIQY